MPKAFRSRACQQCRDRRVKCDETAGFCEMCRRLGLPCSGPLQGTVIIDMTDRIKKPRRRNKREPKPGDVVQKGELGPASANAHGNGSRTGSTETLPTLTPPALQLAEPQGRVSPVHHLPKRAADQVVAALRYQQQPPILYQPSKVVPEALDLAFVSHFVRRMSGMQVPRSAEIPWITHLPTMQEKAVKPALRLSIRATSMAFYATLHKDTTILVDSYRWYIMSLGCQRRSLARIPSHGIPAAEEVLVPIILSLYEVYSGTTTTSLWAHLTAATKILALRGPQNCKGLAYPLFKAMRVSDAHRSMVFNIPSPFSTHEWMTIPFQGQISNAHHDLADVLLLIPGCIGLLKMGGSMRAFFATSIPAAADTKAAEHRTRELIQQLETWAKSHPHLTILPATPSDQIVSTDMKIVAPVGAQPASADGSTMVIPASFIALTAATYNATRLILTLLLLKLCPPTPSSPTIFPIHSTALNAKFATSALFDAAVAASRSILTISHYMESTHPVGFDIIRSVFPLVVVGIIGPRSEEVEQAQTMLERWGKMKGMGGLCSAWLDA